MGQVKAEVEQAINTLGLQNTDITELNKERAGKLYQDLLGHFVKSGDRRWWWEDFKQESFTFINHDRPFELLNEIIPEQTENVWFMVEDDEEAFYPIYEVRPEVIKDIISECFAFEYYVIDKNKEWLLCENHHNCLIGIGQKLKEKNLNLIER
jgi:hypothetical protein